MCKACNTEKVFVRLGIKKGHNWVYVDERNKRWMGAKCPNCRNEYEQSRRKGKYVRATQANRVDTELLGPAFPLFTGKMRRCSKCSLLTVNYYRCKDCMPYRPSSDIMDLYGVAL